MAERAVRSAARRRERWLRSMWRHEQLSVRMAVVTATHHSWKSHAVVGTQTEYVGPACTTATVTTGVNLGVTGLVYPQFSSIAVDGSGSQVVGLLPLGEVSAAIGVNLDVTGMVYPHFSSSAVEVSASQVVGSLPLGEVSAATGVTLDVTGMVYPQFSSTAVEVSSSQVVGSLPLGDVFAAPVFHQVHQEQLAGGDTTENIAHFPVVQEQVIVQDIPEVVVPLPPAQEFSAPVYGQVHQEQFAALSGSSCPRSAIAP